MTTGSPVTAGAVVTGANIYQTTGNSCPNTCSGDCGGSNSVRNEHDNCAPTNYEGTAIIQYGTHGTCDLGTEFDVKLAGPVHDDGRCCWWLFAVNTDENDDGVGEGGFTTGGEGPHPDTGKSCKDGIIPEVEGLGNIEGKIIGIKGVTWANADGTRHFEGWIDRTGSGTNWEKAADQNVTEWGAATDCTGNATQSTSTIESDQQVLFRVDCTDAQWLESRVVKIAPNQRSDGSVVPPTSTTPTTTPPAEEDEEEEEDSGGDEEDDDNNGGDGDHKIQLHKELIH